MAKGVHKAEPWKREMVLEVGNHIKPALDKLYANSQKIYNGHVTKTEGSLPTTKQMLKLFKDGEPNKDWYNATQKELEGVFGSDAELFVKFLAATSPSTTVKANVSLALKAYRQHKSGQAFEGYLGNTKADLYRARRGEDFGGPKVKSFLANLKGDPLPVTVDRWISRAYGFGDSPTAAQYKFIDYAVTQVARKRGIAPREMQAAVWTAMKEARELASGNTSESFEVVLRNKLEKDPELAAAIKQALDSQGSPENKVMAAGASR
jgi:hypothetical protein